jgi:hypothetical protein
VAHPEGTACAAQVTRTAQVSQAGAAALAVLAMGALAAIILGGRASRSGRRATAVARQTTVPARQTTLLAWLVVVALLTLGGVVAALLFLDTSSTVALALTSDVLALLGLALLALPAWLVMRARDPRRFVLAVLGAAVLWLLIFYPNLSGLPLPMDFASIYQGLLPTWNWDFQFAVNTDPAAGGSTIDPGTIIVGVVTVVFVVGVAGAAWFWGRPRQESSLPAAPSDLG